MLMRESDELKIQRCVDNELSSQETSELLRRLDTITDGWRTLACGLLEDRGIRSALPRAKPAVSESALRNADAIKPLVAKAEDEPRVIKVNDVVRHWWSHPVTSLTLCAAIAFVGGLLIPDANNSRSSSDSSRTGVASPPKASQYPLASANGTQQYRVELQPGGRSVEIPVVTDLNELHELDRRHPIFSGAKGGAQNVQWMVLPVEGNKSMLIPVSEDFSSDMQ